MKKLVGSIKVIPFFCEKYELEWESTSFFLFQSFPEYKYLTNIYFDIFNYQNIIYICSVSLLHN